MGRAALSALAKLCGTKAQPLEQVKGGFSFHVQTEKEGGFDLEKVCRRFLEQGVSVFSLESTFENRLGVLPTKDKYQVLLALQTNRQNYDLMPQEVVAWLRGLEKDQPVILAAAGFDSTGGSFTTKVARPATLAKRTYEFCPDVVDQG